MLASLGTARDKAKTAAAQSAMHAIQIDMYMCMLNNLALYCWGTAGQHTTSGPSCGAGAGAYPQWGTAICGNSTTQTNQSTKDWPNVAQYGYSYGAYAYSIYSTGQFDFEIYNGTSAICCTQNGCSTITDAGSPPGQACKTLAGL